MTDLLDFVLEAHGGLKRWSDTTTIRAKLDMGGPSWASRGQDGILSGVGVTVDLHRQHLVFTGFTGPGLRGVFTPDRVAVEDEDGAVLMERHTPRDAYAGHDRTTAWDPLHALYFGGYGMWNYLTAPYLLTLPGVRTEELDPWQEADERWRRLHVTFPSYIATHSTEQTFYYDASGLLRRQDYRPFVMGGRPAVHRVEAHRTVSGLVFPTHRYVLPVVDGNVLPSPIITVDLADIGIE
ncbi:hypothetical protein AB0F77_25270 [Streptomyces sp. NPDC026672]|uniref:hypothetical protein n=1 Tax=unclassified Streptomyces TaxID=2593676 RepID=UPI0033EC3F95